MSDMNRKLITRWFEMMNRGRNDVMKLMNEMFDPKYVCHDSVAGEIKGPESLKKILREFYDAFPDLSFRLENMISEGDLVSYRYSFSGTHKGSFMGVPPTGKHVRAEGICMSIVRDGKIFEEWQVWDAHTLLKQISPAVESLHLVTAP